MANVRDTRQPKQPLLDWIEQSLKTSRNNKTKVAKDLGIAKPTLMKLLNGEPVDSGILGTLELKLQAGRSASPESRWGKAHELISDLERKRLEGDSVEAYWWLRTLSLQVERPFRTAVLVHYSGQWASSLISALLYRGCDVRLYLCHPSEAVSKRQLIRIQDTLMNVESEFSLNEAKTTSRLRIYRYRGDGPGKRCAILEDEIACLGEYVEREGRNRDGTKQKQLHGHDSRCNIKLACQGWDISSERDDVFAFLRERSADAEATPFVEWHKGTFCKYPSDRDLRLDEPLSSFPR